MDRQRTSIIALTIVLGAMTLSGPTNAQPSAAPMAAPALSAVAVAA